MSEAQTKHRYAAALDSWIWARKDPPPMAGADLWHGPGRSHTECGACGHAIRGGIPRVTVTVIVTVWRPHHMGAEDASRRVTLCGRCGISAALAVDDKDVNDE